MFVGNTSVLAGAHLLEPETAVWRFAPLAARSYDVLVIDPPWPLKTRSPKGQLKSASMHYRTMTLAEIKELPVKDDAIVYLSTTGPLLDDAIGYNAPFPQITVINKRDTPALMSKKIFLDSDGKLKSDGSECRMITGAVIIAQLIGDDTAQAGDIVARSRSPVFALCRASLAAGANPDSWLECYRSGVLALRVKSMGIGATLTVEENATRGRGSHAGRPFPARTSSPLSFK
jgi:hypothetical protein